MWFLESCSSRAILRTNLYLDKNNLCKIIDNYHIDVGLRIRLMAFQLVINCGKYLINAHPKLSIFFRISTLSMYKLVISLKNYFRVLVANARSVRLGESKEKY